MYLGKVARALHAAHVGRHKHVVGCAMTACYGGTTFVICNYDLPGNFVGERSYEQNRAKWVQNVSLVYMLCVLVCINYYHNNKKINFDLYFLLRVISCLIGV